MRHWPSLFDQDGWIIPCGTKFLREFFFFFRIGVFFCCCFAGTNFCDQERLVFLSGNKFLRFSESNQYPALTAFSVWLSTCNRNAYFQTIQQCASAFQCISLFLSERDKLYSQLSLNRHLYKTDTSVKRTPGVGPCFSLLPLFDSL